MPTLNVQALPEAAAVELIISDVAGVDTILRADVNGTRPVRLRDGALSGSGGRRVTDYEPALSGPVLYRVQHATSPAEAWADLSAVELPRFILPSIPQFSVEVQTITGYSAARPSTANFHDVIGRSSGPLVAEGKLGARSGDFSAVFRSYAAAQDLNDMLARGQAALLRQVENPGMDMYFHAENTKVSGDAESGIWTLDVQFREVGFPPGPVLSRDAWNFDALRAAYPDFDAVALAFETFHDLTIGETK